MENKKVFIIEEVEDDAPIRGALRDKLAREGFTVLEAKNGTEGLTLAFKEHPDLILLDILMPGMDGITMMKQLREENEWGKHVPVILLTNLGSDNEKINQAITAYEPAYYLVKSDWSINDIVDKIKERLSRTA